MDKETGKQAWVAPVLEKIEMVDTRAFTPNCGSQGLGMKNQFGPEMGQCGQGS